MFLATPQEILQELVGDKSLEHFRNESAELGGRISELQMALKNHNKMRYVSWVCIYIYNTHPHDYHDSWVSQ
jgi:hypothetical protein